MKDEDKTKVQLKQELAELRRRVAELELGQVKPEQIDREESLPESTAGPGRVDKKLQQEIAKYQQMGEAFSREDEVRYQDLFENSPISLWEEDLSAVKSYLDNLRQAGITDFRHYFDQHPEAVSHCVGLIKVVDVNQATLNLYQATDKKELLDHADEIFRSDLLEIIKEELVALTVGQTRFESESVRHTLTGNKIYVEARLTIVPGYEDSYEKVLVSLIDLTERKRAEEAYRVLVDHSLQGLSILQDEQVIFVNQALAWMLGYSVEELRSMSAAEMHRVMHFRDQTVISPNRQGQPVGEVIPTHYEVRAIRKDGTGCWLEHFVTLIEYQGRPAIQVVSIDITERKQAEVEREQHRLAETWHKAALQQRNRELALLNRAGQSLTSSLDLDQVLSTILEEVRRLLDVVACSIWLIDPENNDLVCRQASGPQRQLVCGWRLAPGQGLVGWAAQWGRSLIVPDIRADDRHFRGVDQQTGLTIRAVLTVPLQTKQGVIGVIQVLDKQVNRFSSSDQTLLESLASTAAIAIENAQLYEETDRLRAFNQNIVHNIEEGIILEDAAGCITFVNPKAASLLEYPPQALIGRPSLTLVPPECKAQVEAESAKRSEGIANQYEAVLLTSQGRRMPVIISACPLFESGQFSGVLSVFTDITRRKQMEEALTKAEREKALILDSISELVAYHNQEMTMVWANRSSGESVGLQAEELVGRHCYEVWHNQDQICPGCPVHKTFSTGQFEEAEITSPDGRIWYTRAYPVYGDGDSVVGVVEVGRDITERKQSEEALHRYTERLRILHTIDQAILNAQSPQIIGQVVLDYLYDLKPYMWAAILEIDPETGQVRVLAAYANNGIELAEEVCLSDLPQGLKEGELYLVNDLMAVRHPLPRETWLQEAGIRSYVDIPLVVQEELIGLLRLAAAQPDFFTEDSLSIAKEVAVSLAVAVRQARLFEQTRQDAETRAVLLREVNHRVKNNLTAIIGMLYAEARYAEKEQGAACQTVMLDLINRIQGLATVHHLLSASEWAPLSLSELIRQVIESALQALPFDKRVWVNISPADIQVTPDQAGHLAMVINELTTNTIKYALSERSVASVTVQITGEEDDTILVAFRDDGPGYPEETLHLEQYNVGVYLIQNIVQKELNGEVTLYNDQGAVTLIRFPLKIG